MYVNKRTNEQQIDNKKVVALLFIAFVIANSSQVMDTETLKNIHKQIKVEKNQKSRSEIKNSKKQIFFNSRVQCNKKNNI
ncbi:hypothetical protein DDB_G0291518 [Dictyostelium discoideum AX4]|uniref:Uncharacterized protein n=1 Tax=Dictyostelium discoideum TaxID=44689 RepID=Q54EG8_DICDI|nr:hypothetical protein DDB_G0291518 [Dictyostelium discoideum AX4]EAL61743.1 hypothetical protein DDB_G0291518 [Dictyostelium discoideum AX4]|eukprot:XP_635272.1 hypothetical protein DDB_G0291518 [Dictyostelium discoideum AX4]